MPTAWAAFANPTASLIAASLAVLVLIALGYHRDATGALTRRRLTSVIGLAASCYTFVVLVASQLLLDGPSVATLIREGFGDERIAWLLLLVTVDQFFRLWDEYRAAS